ncbi:MAG: hypothetical protein ACLPOA_15875 [Methylocella sp.]
MHLAQLTDQGFNAYAVVVGFLELERYGPQISEPWCVVERDAPYFGRREAGMAVHVEASELIVSGATTPRRAILAFSAAAGS